MPTFTYQLLAVFALSAPGLAVLIGFFYSEKPRTARSSVLISTTPPPPTAFVSLGVVLLAALAIHVATMCLFLLFDAVGSFVLLPSGGLRPYDRLLDVAKNGNPTTSDLLLSAVILLGQVAAGLGIGRSIPSLIISGRLPLASVYGWLTPYVAAARDDDKVVFASVVLKANAKEGLLLGYDGVVTSIRLDSDFAVKTIVLGPANRFVLSMSSTGRGGGVSGADVAGAADTSQSEDEAGRKSVPSVTLSGAEIFSTSLAISDISDYASELDLTVDVAEPAERSWRFRAACAVLLLLVPATMLRWPVPSMQPIHLPDWMSGVLAIAIAVLSTISMSTRSTGRDSGRVDGWIATACILSAFLPMAALTTGAGAMPLLAMVGVTAATAALIALVRLSKTGSTATDASRLLQTLLALVFVSLLQAVASHTPVDGADIRRIALSCFAVVAAFVAFALAMRTLTGNVLLCAWAGGIALGVANQARATADTTLTFSLLLFGCVCIIEVMAFGLGVLTSLRANRERTSTI